MIAGLPPFLNKDANHEDERHTEEHNNIDWGDKVDELGRHQNAPSQGEWHASMHTDIQHCVRSSVMSLRPGKFWGLLTSAERQHMCGVACHSWEFDVLGFAACEVCLK